MIEYYLWVKVEQRTSYPDKISDEVYRKEWLTIYNLIKAEFEKIYENDQALHFNKKNAAVVITAVGICNHKSLEFDEIFSLFKYVGDLATGSYGLLYLRDDEDEDHDNEFQVWRLARGKVEKMKDPFLSPCIPTVEDKLEWWE